MPDQKKYKHVFFDLDETLWDFKRNSVETIRDLMSLYQLENVHSIDGNLFIDRYHLHNEYYWDLYRKGQISRQDLRWTRWQKTLEEFSVKDEGLTKTLSEKYLELLSFKKNLLADAMETLTYLKSKYSLHIITNGFEEVQLRKIEVSGIGHYFIHIITSERAGYQKPNKEIFLFAFDLTGATVHDSIFIGDSIEADINGAKAVGMDYIYFNPARVAHQETVSEEIDELRKLTEIL